jgi:hypothetical protein
MPSAPRERSPQIGLSKEWPTDEPPRPGADHHLEQIVARLEEPTFLASDHLFETTEKVRLAGLPPFPDREHCPDESNQGLHVKKLRILNAKALYLLQEPSVHSLEKRDE